MPKVQRNFVFYDNSKVANLLTFWDISEPMWNLYFVFEEVVCHFICKKTWMVNKLYTTTPPPPCINEFPIPCSIGRISGSAYITPLFHSHRPCIKKGGYDARTNARVFSKQNEVTTWPSSTLTAVHSIIGFWGQESSLFMLKRDT